MSAKEGLRQGLHNESLRDDREVDGKRTYDLLFDLLDPELVKFGVPDVDNHARLHRATNISQYPGRFFSMHVQDVDLNAEAPPRRRRSLSERAATRTAVSEPPQGRQHRLERRSRGGQDWRHQGYFVEQSMELTKRASYLKTLNV